MESKLIQVYSFLLKASWVFAKGSNERKGHDTKRLYRQIIAKKVVYYGRTVTIDLKSYKVGIIR